jgi:Tfp pilus assembly protein FimV
MSATDTTAPAGAASTRQDPVGARRSLGAAPPPRRPLARATVLRRRLVALAGLVLLLTLATVAVGRVGAEAELADRVAGHEVLTPGDTLWDVAVRSAPEGVDPRDQMIAIRELNGFGSGSLDAWTVVLLPAR